MRILALGDVFGNDAVGYIEKNLCFWRDRENIDFVIINCENADGASGVEAESAKRLLTAGADVLTGGNHTFGRRSFIKALEENEDILRPANYPAGTPGGGYTIKKQNGVRILVVNALGVIFLEPLASPFESVEKILAWEKGNYDISLLDIHAEANSEKKALAYAFDGKISAVYGTHTHIPTADETILARGTGYISDIGMCGPEDSILGVKPECIVKRLTARLPNVFETAGGVITAQGAIFDINADNGACLGVERITFR